MASLQDAIVGALGGSAADSETISLIETVIENEANGKTGVPDLSFLPFGNFGATAPGQGGGFGISILKPYLQAFIVQQEHPYTFPIIIVTVGFLSLYGLASLLGD